MAGAALATKPQGAKTQSNAPALLVPFDRAANEHTEVFDDRTVALTTSATTVGPIDVAAYGFMRGVYMNVVASGGVGSATVAAAEDAPWSLFDEVVILDVNGAPLVGPLSGYDLYLINKYGGYDRHSPDPKQDPGFAAVATGASASGNFAFQLRIPVEVCGRDGLGALANMNAASTYKIRYTLAASNKLYTTAPNTTLPSVRVRLTLDAWTQPTQTDLRGNAQATLPPAHGTLSYWSKTTLQVSAGSQTVRLPRVGNYLRELIFVYRDASGSRVAGAANFPDPASIYWDTRLLKSYLRDLWRNQMKKRLDLTGAVETGRGLDNGVFLEDYCHEWDGGLGYELRDGWIPTAQSTRFELSGSFGVAGVLTVLTNDVAPAGDIFV